ncbi:hypothetical protein [Flavobacterium sp. ZS1P14]|uniref:hypothetical protein n=1 Tax=Flavobacterium sp. ZS1P14 TaxID=3401729 RepID=UPI003AAEDBA7
MKLKIITILILFTTIISCSKDEDACKCNEYLKSSNGTLTLYGGVSMALCDGTLPNPSPQLTVYKKECK